MKILISPSTAIISTDKATAQKWNVDRIMAYGSDIDTNLYELPFKESDDVMILIPTILDNTNALAYDGANMALRILFKTIRKRQKGINIVLLGCETMASFLIHYPYPNILKIPGISYSLFNRKIVAELEDSTCSINQRKDYKDFIMNLGINLPSSFKSTHSVTNEWCLFKWNSFMDFDRLTEDESLGYLYFDYTKAVEKIHQVKYKSLKDSETMIQNIELLKKKDTRILLIDDNPQWHRFFERFFADSMVKFKSIGENFRKMDINDLIEQVNENVKCFEPEVILLDFRLIEDRDAEKEFDEISGTRVLKELKGNFEKPGIAYGTQILIFTATSRIENILRLQKFNADGFILKEKPEQYASKKITKKLISEMVRDITSAVDRAKFLIPLNQRLLNLWDLVTRIEFKNNALKEAIKTIAESVRLITQNNELNEGILKFVYLNIFKIFEEIKNHSGIISFPNKYSLTIHANNDLSVCSHDKSSIYRPSGDNWNCTRKLNKSSWHHPYCTKRDLNFAICATILFRLGKNQVDDTDWNDIRNTRNDLVHDKIRKISPDKLKCNSLKMLDLIYSILNPENIREIDPNVSN